MSKIKKIKVNNVNYDLGVDYSNVDNKPDLSLKQDTLVSGTNIKTINNQSLLGSGNITIEGGGETTDVQINGSSITSSGTANIVTEGVYNPLTNKMATMNDVTPALQKQMIEGQAITITPANNTLYECGELTSLIISNPPLVGSYTIIFSSGSTPTDTIFPLTINGLDDFIAEANTRYEINVLDGYAVVGSWVLN